MKNTLTKQKSKSHRITIVTITVIIIISIIIIIIIIVIILVCAPLRKPSARKAHRDRCLRGWRRLVAGRSRRPWPLCDRH